MQYSDRVVTKIPLDVIWTDEGEIHVKRSEHLNEAQIKHIIGNHTILFVVADVGKKLRWVPIEECYAFWKSDVKNHVVEPSESIYRDHHQQRNFHLASEWTGELASPIILLEMLH